MDRDLLSGVRRAGRGGAERKISVAKRKRVTFQSLGSRCRRRKIGSDRFIAVQQLRNRPAGVLVSSARSIRRLQEGVAWLAHARVPRSSLVQQAFEKGALKSVSQQRPTDKSPGSRGP